MKLRVLDLFSGIGGFSLGLERSGGFETVAFCEIEPYCRAVLKKHWPDVPCYDDVRTLTADRLAADGIAVDVICGGFPCQDISDAGKRIGLSGERSGLWREYGRLIGELRPRFVIVENVAALLGRGLGDVLGDLAALGFDAEWDCIPASSIGAPHQRDRLWIIAYSDEGRREQLFEDHGRNEFQNDVVGSSAESQPQRSRGICWFEQVRDVADADEKLFDRTRPSGSGRWGQSPDGGWWASEPDVGRVAHGVPSRVDRIGGLGNAVVPQIPELIGRAILKAEGMTQ
jgi:DNA (cytosine-5)-methyltransferase 1